MGSSFSSLKVTVGQQVLIHAYAGAYIGGGVVSAVNEKLAIVTVDGTSYQFLNEERWSSGTAHYSLHFGESFDEAKTSGSFVKWYTEQRLELPAGVVLRPRVVTYRMSSTARFSAFTH